MSEENKPEASKKEGSKSNSTIYVVAVITVVASLFVGMLGGGIGYLITSNTNYNDLNKTRELISQDVTVLNQESAIIDVAEATSDSVVSIVISQDVPIYENYNPWEELFNPNFRGRQQIGTEERQVGAGTGFIISPDGMVITNRHVVDTTDASYTVIFNDGSKKDAKVLSIDSLLDIAFIKIDDASDLQYLELGTSENLKVGQSVIAIGNALGEFSNSVSSGIVSGLARDIIASDGSGRNSGQLNGLIQTDASINLGNSGGPLLDLSGKVIGVNVAMANGAENIGFAIPIDDVIKLIERLDEETGEIKRPYLGVRYQMLNEEIATSLELDITEGALIIGDNGAEQFAVASGSPADKAGLESRDVVVEIDGEKVTEDNTLFEIIQQKFIGDEVSLKVYRDGEYFDVNVTLEEFEF